MYDKKTVEAFLKNQLQLFPETVVDTPEEAAEFLEDVCAVVCKNKKEVIEYLEDEILSSEEVFAIGDGRYLIVEG